jgi:GGDEF domain-containing protein
VGTSIGIATHPGDGKTATELIAAADAGLYVAKAEGGSKVRVGPLGRQIADVAQEPATHAFSGRHRITSLRALVGGGGRSGGV